MNVKEFDKLCLDDFGNGAVLDDIRRTLQELEDIKHPKKEKYERCPKCYGSKIGGYCPSCVGDSGRG